MNVVGFSELESIQWAAVVSSSEKVAVLPSVGLNTHFEKNETH